MKVPARIKSRLLIQFLFVFFSGVGLLKPVRLQAHPGHGSTDPEQTLWHYATEPMHLAPLLGLVAIVIWTLVRTRILRRQLQKQRSHKNQY